MEFNRSYLIGRDEDCDFQVNSTLVSRQQLQLKLGLVDKQQLKVDDYKTPLVIGILSRARSKINGASYKLAKNEKPLEHDFTQEKLIYIEFKDSDNPLGLINYEIEWIPFNIMPTTTDTKSSLFNDLKRLHHESIDLRIVTDIANATHCYTLQDIPKGNTEDYNNVCLAMAKGIPILTNAWFKFVYEKNQFQDWFLDVDYKQYLPKYDGNLLVTALPNSSRSSVLNGLTAFSFNEFQFEENLITLMGGKVNTILLIKYFLDGKLDQSKLFEEIKLSGKCVLVRYAPTDKIKFYFPINDQLEEFCKTYISQIVNRDFLVECLKSCTVGKITPLDVTSLKHPLETSTQLPTQGRRKRVKYEKVGKMHFFDLEATPSQPESTPQLEATPLQPEPSPVPVPVINDSKESTAPTVIEKQGNTIMPVDPPSSPASPPDNLQDSQPANDISKLERFTLKRSNSNSDQPRKIAKFMPDYKVSLSTAIQQTKALASKLVEEELGIENKDEEINGGMENLVIVEMVDIPMRNVPNQVDNDRYAGRKNFKTFKKNMKVKSNVTRSFVDLEDASITEQADFVDDIAEPQISAEAQMENQFNGFIKDVVVPEGNGLFVEDSDTEEMPESIFTSRTDSSRTTKPTSRPISKPRRTLYNNDSDGGDDDDDDDDDGPKFGFTRKR